MENLPFVLWLLGWPMVDLMYDYFHGKLGKPYKNKKEWIIFFWAVWVFVAVLIYRS